jgi:hypothetical protein
MSHQIEEGGTDTSNHLSLGANEVIKVLWDRIVQPSYPGRVNRSLRGGEA